MPAPSKMNCWNHEHFWFFEVAGHQKIWPKTKPIYPRARITLEPNLCKVESIFPEREPPSHRPPETMAGHSDGGIANENEKLNAGAAEEPRRGARSRPRGRPPWSARARRRRRVGPPERVEGRGCTRWPRRRPEARRNSCAPNHIISCVAGHSEPNGVENVIEF